MYLHAAGTLALVCLVTAGAVQAQTGLLSGVVKDSDTKEELIGVDVVVSRTEYVAQTDLDGRFELVGLPPGIYTLRLSYLGYNPRELADVKMTADGRTDLVIELDSFDAFETDDVVVTATRVFATEAAMLAARQQAPVIGDVIGADQIARAPDGTSGDVLRRVTGLQVTAGKYVFVRGVPPRYNKTELDGVQVTSADTDADKESFSFDLVPANLIANTVVIKTATPDMPGDFTGGLVRINTLEFPDRATTSVGISAAHNTSVTGNDFSFDPHGKQKTFLGLPLPVDDGTRTYPDVTCPPASGGICTALAKALPNSWTTDVKNAPPKYTFNISHGNKFRLFGNDFGLLLALSYRNTTVANDFTEVRGLTIPGFGHFISKQGEGTVFTNNILAGGLANLSYRFNTNHLIAFRNNFSGSARNHVSESHGFDSDKDWQRQSIEYQERWTYLGHLAGQHVFPGLLGLEIDWNGSYSKSEAEEPDRRYIEYNTDEEPASMDENLRSWSWINDDQWAAAADAVLPLDSSGEVQIKGGVSWRNRERAFDIKPWASDPGYNAGLTILPLDTIFDPDNYGTNEEGLYEFIPFTDFTGAYDGSLDVAAYYFMLDAPFSIWQEDFRVVFGARIEDAVQEVVTKTSGTVSTQIDTARIDNLDLLPSINFTYQYDHRTNLRLAYFESLNRPQFREMAPVRYYDFNRFQDVLGNPDLQRALIRNYDARVEWFPGMGEVLAASVFYKKFTDPIEEALISAPTRNILTWFNSPEGKNWGWELEARIGLAFLGRLVSGFTVLGNYTRIESEIEYLKTDYSSGLPELVAAQRPMQGQAPWAVNVGLLWDYDNWGTSVSVFYNSIGERLVAVGNTENLNVYAEPRDKIDLTFAQRLTEVLKLKFTIKDLLAEDQVFNSGPVRDEYSRITGGTEYKAAASYAF